MDNLKAEIGGFLKVLGAVLVTGLGARILLRATGGVLASDSGWLWIPKVCGTLLVVVGAAALVYQVIQRVLGTVTIDVDPPMRSFSAPPPPPPPPPPPSPESEKKTRTKSRRKSSRT